MHTSDWPRQVNSFKVTFLFFQLLDDNRELFIPETQETVKAHRRFMLFATQNPPGQYGGRKVCLNIILLRMWTVDFFSRDIIYFDQSSLMYVGFF